MRNEARPVFLGGVIAALILRLSFAPYPYDFVAWFALVPLLFSLHRNRHRPWLRFFHGVTFSLLMILWCNSWFFTALSLGSGAPDSNVDYARAAVSAGLAWIVSALFTGLFSVASGRLFRSERRLALIVGLPTLWMGLEVLRGPLAPIPSPWISGWLSLGYALDPARPEAQVASLIGVHGVSFLMVLCSTLLLACLLTPSFRAQLAYGVLAAAIPLAAFGHGRLVTPGSARTGDTPVAMISQVDDTPEAVLEFAASVAATNPEIILWSDIALRSSSRQAAGDSREELESFLTRLASVWAPRPDLDSPGMVLMTDDGRLVAVYRSPGDTDGQPPPANRTYRTAAGTFVLGLDFDFLVPRAARVASAAGAQLLVSSARTREAWGEKAQLQQLGMASFRAVENRRWLVMASSTGAYVIDPYGRAVLELRRGFDSAGVESVSFLSERSFYSLYGWWLEPLSLCGAVTILIVQVVPGRKRREEPGDRLATGAEPDDRVSASGPLGPPAAPPEAP